MSDIKVQITIGPLFFLIFTLTRNLDLSQIFFEQKFQKAAIV